MPDKPKKDLPSLPLFTDTFVAETVHLTNEQTGIYMRLLCFAWTKKGKPFTSQSAHTICQCKSVNCELVVNQILDEFFIRGENRNTWTHKRIIKEQDYLNDYYEKKSIAGRKGGLAKRDSANSKSLAHIPIPIPIPTNTLFETFWDNVSIKRGSKKVAEIKYKKECKDLDPKELARVFNAYAAKIPDKQFVQHVSTWLSQRRFQDEDIKSTNEPTLIDRMKKLGYKHRGSEGSYEQFVKDGKNYKLHKFKQDAQIELEP